MSSTSTHARKSFVLLVDGLPWAWTSNQELCTGWWTYDDREILPGLLVPDLRFALDLERGVIQDEQTVFKILDVDGEILPSFFSGLAKDYKLLGQRLPPTVDPAPASSFDQYGDPLTLWDGTSGCFLGLEAIGPNGERRWYSCWPTRFIAGDDHGGGIDDAQPVHTTWEEGPFLVEGRKACLFRIWANDDGTWPAFDPASDRPSWWGTTLQAGGVDGRTWSLPFSGPASWLQKTLNAKAPTTWFRVKAELELSAQEDTIYIGCFKLGYSGLSAVCGSITDTVADGSIDDVITSIQGHVATAIAASGPDGVWEDPDPIPGTEGNVIWNEHSISLWTDDDAGYAAYLLVRLHWKVWRFLGFDPEQHLYDIADGPYFESDLVNPGYHYAVISTTPAGKNPLIPDGNVDWDGDGLTRVYQPEYPGGVVTLSGQGKQVVQIADVAGEPIYCESQTIRPAKTSVTINGSACNATRWWVFRGMEQRAIGPGQLSEPEEVYRVARCSWLDQDGIMGSSDGLFADLYIESWHDPRLFGLNFQPMDPQLGWAGPGAGEEGGIYCTPLAVWGIWSERNPSTGRGSDKLDDVLGRAFASSGASTVDPAADDPGDAELATNYPGLSYLTPGPNGYRDLEIADLGLGLPEPMFDDASFIVEAQHLPGGLQEVKVAAVGPVQAEEVLLGLLGPGDWSLSLAGGRYGVFRRSDLGYTPSLIIGISDLAGVAGDPASCIPGLDLRPVQPFDRLTVTHTANPVEDPLTGQEERQYRARDLGSRARTGVRQRDVSAPYLPARRWWTDGPAPVASWETDFQGLWEHDVATWLAKPHRGIRGLRVSRPKGQFIFPGVLLSLSLPWPLNTQGGYGMTNVIGRVTAVTHEADSCDAVVDILVHADTVLRQVWAPIARVVDDVEEPEERYDPDTRTFHLQPWREDGSYFNVDVFVEPSWSSVGGNAAFCVLQYDGVSWRQTCSGVVDSVDPVAGTITTQGLTGTFYERMYAFICIAPYDDVNQALWPKAVFAILGPAAGLPESRKLAK
ncbi:hypothetical protein [Nannocystis sp. SCPEA4]|uniref:hypothetical protein n=1 Tax=Nannocystis sp. SCPEA4 TaxID=2996787 RepID=UPI00226E7348|nr:hypothetical protein [Nannocystis sp. SCPEA4]MCY1055442.1 hypothetical protein [Nannocystis sp. SCPEA4]